MAATDPQTAADAAERVQRWLDEWSFKVQSNLVATGCGRAEPDGCTELTAADIDALLTDRTRLAAELERRGQLLGIGVDREQWDAIAEAEGRRYEGEQTDDTIVGYLAYSRENARIARDTQRARNEKLAAELEQVRGNDAEQLLSNQNKLLDHKDQVIAALRLELEQVRSDWLTQAAQLNRIAAIVGHALILRVCDDATPEEIRFALAKACEDVHEVIGESEATRGQRTERYLAMCAGLINHGVVRQHDDLLERAERLEAELEAIRDEQAHDCMAIVAMLDGVEHYRAWLADAYDPDAPAPDPASAMYRRAHELRARFAGRLFAAGYDPETTATRPADGPTGTRESQRTHTPAPSPQRGSGDVARCICCSPLRKPCSCGDSADHGDPNADDESTP